ncbi:uncharacterized protein LOC109845591 [Asparagus officinalis]|uniref:uncharacterized protein LOC109845591 n=1 Tax=Asparagus officinalis TaxID=4686 RepID=UPI00098DE403|nr:uncharacterized protein LOC109845591 [Asparagus officinalis]
MTSLDDFSFNGDLLMKLAMFVLVQALVYLILSKSSNVFSPESKMRSRSFKPARSVSIRRMLALISDLPPGGETSPSSDSSVRGNSASAFE